MQVHRDIETLPRFRNGVITIGTFDGVHKGHRQVIEKLKAEATAIGGETVLITFHPHPRKVIVSAVPGIRLINTLNEKIELLEQLNIDHLVIVPFTDEFARQPAEVYVRDFLIGKFHPHTIIIGHDHRFGKERKGDYLLLENLAAQYHYRLKEISKHMLDEISVSSTKIRESLLDGKIETADKLLGYEFFFSGTVVHGDKLGRTLGYPTANLQIEDEEKLTPGNGIYAVHASITGQSITKGQLLKGMMSIGIRPTVGGKKRVIEVNLFNFDKDIYGQTLKVFMRKYLREEIKFDSLEELVKQIDQDKLESLKVLQES